MNKITQKEKLVIRMARTASDEKLADFILSGDISLERIKSLTILPQNRKREIERIYNEKKSVFEEENNLWDKAKSSDRIEDYEEYLASYPNGKFSEEAREKIDDLYFRQRSPTDYLSKFPNGKYADQAGNSIRVRALEIEANKKSILNDIKTNSHDYGPTRVLELIENGDITEDDLIDTGIIPRDKLDLFLSPPEFFDGLHTFKDLPDLPHDRTDVYFFGTVSSGKTCLLAGLLASAFRSGRIQIEVNNPEGPTYAGQLLKSVQYGVAPPSTSNDGINYISANLFESQETDSKQHPLNIIEMSGEKFNKSYQTMTIQGEESLGAYDYLNNDNPKIVFLVIDYQSSTDAKRMDDQAVALDRVLGLLDKDGTLKKTDGVFIVITKSDKLPNGEQDYAAANNFIDSKFLALRSNLRRFAADHRIKDTGILCFSLGQFYSKDIFEYSPVCSDIIVQKLITVAFSTKRNPGRNIFGKLFNR